jgi:phytoene dehydrogenase-like protein
MSSKPTTESYDTAIIGAGLAGLTAGALLARAGKQVIVVEAEDRPGGYVRSIDAGGYQFDPAVHLVMGGNRGGSYGAGLIREVVELLGVGDRCEFLGVDPFYTVHLPDFRLDVPTGREAYVAAHADIFPDDASGLSELIEQCFRIYEESFEFPIKPRIVDWLTAPIRFPNLVRHRKSTVRQILERHLADPRLKTVIYALMPYLGLPPSDASFATWATMMASFIDEGAYYCRGGFQSLANAFADGARRQGVEIILGRRVERILVSDGRTRGIELEDGRSIASPQVIAAMDARETFGQMVDVSAVPAGWMRRIEDTPVSISVLSLYLGTDLDVASLGVCQENLIYRTWDLEEAFRGGLAGQPQTVLVTIPSLAEPEVAPPGCHQVNVGAMAPAGGVDVDAAQFADDLIEIAEEILPGLRNHLRFVLGPDSQPAPPSAPTLHQIGPIYGWRAAPDSSLAYRLPQRTPIAGLYLAGQWTQPGHGVWTVVASGIRAARLVLDLEPAAGLRPLRF